VYHVIVRISLSSKFIKLYSTFMRMYFTKQYKYALIKYTPNYKYMLQDYI